MKNKTMTAVKLRMILVAALTLIILAHIGIPLLGQHLLIQNSKSVTEAVSHETSSRETLENLESAQQILKDQKDTVEKAKQLFADAKSYNYQRQVIEDISAYATMAGVGITGFTFSDSQDGSTGTAATGAAPATPTAPAPAPAGPAAAPTPGSPTSGSTKSATVTVNLQSPIQYETFLKFIKLIQGNVTQFRIQTMNLSGGSGGSETSTEGAQTANGTSVDMPSLTMEVYLKQ